MTITARAPAKIILSGEHAVVYGQPALAITVNKYAYTTIKPLASNNIVFNFVNLDEYQQLTWQKLLTFKKEIERKKFLKHSFELLQYAFSYFVEKLKISFDHGLEVVINSSIPVGCGMGSSAATIVSMLHAVASFFAKKIDLAEYLVLGKAVENLQHGLSSGLDLFLSSHGGCYFWEQGEATKKSMLNIPFILVNSGKPISTTGECVSHVAEVFHGSKIADDFAEVTTVMDLAIKDNNLNAVQQCVRENHQLLQHIGVVPAKVQKFISQVEAMGAAAKISGAGAINGENAGVILIVGKVDLTVLAEQFGYEILPVHGEAHGVTLVDNAA